MDMVLTLGIEIGMVEAGLERWLERESNLGVDLDMDEVKREQTGRAGRTRGTGNSYIPPLADVGLSLPFNCWTGLGYRARWID